METAIATYERSLDQLGFTADHPKYASMLAIHGLILRDLGDLSRAERRLLDAMQMQETILGETNLMKAETMLNIGTVLHRLGRKRDAREFFDRSSGMLNLLAKRHPMKATVAAAIGRLVLDMQDSKSAYDYFNDALSIRSDVCGRVHPNVALYHLLMSSSCDSHVMANHHIREAVDIYKSLVEREKRGSESTNTPPLTIIKEWQNEYEDLELDVPK